jgi:hypothetical protein
MYSPYSSLPRSPLSSKINPKRRRGLDFKMKVDLYFRAGRRNLIRRRRTVMAFAGPVFRAPGRLSTALFLKRFRALRVPRFAP